MGWNPLRMILINESPYDIHVSHSHNYLKYENLKRPEFIYVVPKNTSMKTPFNSLQYCKR